MRRAAEIRGAIEAARERGYRVAMVTLTVSHGSWHRLEALLEAFTRARSWLFAGRPFRRWADTVGFLGSIRNAEVTWGEATGWHPHAHVLVFLRDVEAFEAALPWLRDRWVQACEKFGLEASVTHGLHATTADDGISGYLAKFSRPAWGAPEELAFSHSKRGRDRLTPFDLVRGFAATGDLALADRWNEYLDAYHGRRQLVWSRGLRDALGLGVTVSDEAAANAVQDEENTIVHVFSEVEWKLVVRADARAALLVAFVMGGLEAFHVALDAVMRGIPPPALPVALEGVTA